MSIRVHDLAKHCGLTNKEMLEKLKAMNYPVKSHSSTVDKITAEAIEKEYGYVPPPPEAAPAPPAAPVKAAPVEVEPPPKPEPPELLRGDEAITLPACMLIMFRSFTSRYGWKPAP